MLTPLIVFHFANCLCQVRVIRTNQQNGKECNSETAKQRNNKTAKQGNNKTAKQQQQPQLQLRA